MSDDFKKGAFKKSSLVGEKISIQIEKMVVGGQALARHEGLVVFVDDAAPGDQLTVQITEHKKNLAYAQVLSLDSSSQLRAKPVCTHYGICGGCSWQHLNSVTQLDQKQKIVESSLRALLAEQSIQLLPIIKSPVSFNYRNRVQMTFDGKDLCFYGRRSQNLIPIHQCELAEKPINDFIQSGKKKNFKPQQRYEIRISETNPDYAESFLVSEDTTQSNFSQVNRFQNQDLIDSAIKALKSDSQSRLFELYAGSGNFTFPFYKNLNFKEIIAVEGSQKLVSLAHHKIQAENISAKKLNFFVGDVEGFLNVSWPKSDDVVFLDPPRIGSSETTMKILAISKPRQIVYLSCHPVTLARDLQWLMQYQPRYKIEFIQPFEMFPQTEHVETLVSLTLTDN